MPSAVSLSNKKSFLHIDAATVQKPVVFFLLFWTVLNLVQATSTELTSDEGYYWFYSQHLQWGYYDHPPMVALLIKLSGWLFPGELGVRFFNVVLSTAGLSLFFSLLPDAYKNRSMTYFVLLSAPLLHYLAFIVFPDGPLLFCVLLFLVAYKRFLKERNFVTSLLLGLSLAFMAYSKYHGALVLLFTVFANPRLLASGFFYLSLLVTLLLFAPHLWWQYQHQFPTIQYHLSGRTGEWSFRHVSEYVSQQIAVIGPGFVFLPFVCRAKDIFERTLKFIIVGTFAFFLFSSFKTFVHFHWTSIALYPLLYFAVKFYNEEKNKKLFRWLLLPFVVLLFTARLLLMVPLIQGMHAGEDYYHGRKAWAKEIADIAGNKPVFMPNNLREASLYSFYSGKMGVTLYNRPEKKSQYELWGYEDSLQGKDVLLVTKYPFERSSELVTKMGQKIFYDNVSSFQSFYTGITIKAILQPLQPSDTVLHALLEISNERQTPILFGGERGNEPSWLTYSLEKDNRVVRADHLQGFLSRDSVSPKTSIWKEVIVPVNKLPKGEYQIYFGIAWGVLPDAVLSASKRFEKAGK